MLALAAIGILTALLLVILLTRDLERREAAYLKSCLSSLSKSGDGMVAVVTGATSGIGEKLCEMLGGTGMHVYLCYRNVERGKASVSRILRVHPTAKVTPLYLDVTIPSSVNSAAAKLRSSHKHIDFIIANAGVMPVDCLRWTALFRSLVWCRMRSFLETGRAWQGSPHFMEGGGSGSQLDTHVLGHLALLQELGPCLLGGSSRVVWSASRAADTRAVNWAYLSGGRGRQCERPPFTLPLEAYSEAKAVLELVSRRVSAELGVDSVAVCPGFVETPIAPPFFAAMSPLFRYTRVLAPSMTLSLERGVTAHLGAMVEPMATLNPMHKYVLKGGGIGPATQGCVETGMEREAWRICNEWVKSGVWTRPPSISLPIKPLDHAAAGKRRGGRRQ